MGMGFGFCCCECTITGLLNNQFVLKSQTAGENWHTVRLGISGPEGDCDPFLSSSPADLGFLLHWESGGSGEVYRRTGRPDGVEIELKTYGTPFDTSLDSGDTYAFAPEYIHLTLGDYYLHFDFEDSGSPYDEDQPYTITSNCPGGCNWAAPTLSSWIQARHWLEADIPATITLDVSGVTSGMIGDPTCLLHNTSWPIPFDSAATFDGYMTDAEWVYLGSPDQSGFAVHAVPLPGPCAASFPGLVAALHSPGGGYFIQTSLLCTDSKDAWSATWPNLVFANLEFCGACGFGCDVTGIAVAISE